MTPSRIASWPLLAVAALVAGGSSFDQDSKPATQDAKVADLAFMTGAWRAKQGATEIEEFWTPARAGSILGTNRTIKGDKTAFFEFLRIVEKKDGVYYVAQPGGRPPTEFKLAKVAKDEAVFENPKHDFPRKIAYVKRADGALVATVSGEQGGKPASEVFEFLPIR